MHYEEITRLLKQRHQIQDAMLDVKNCKGTKLSATERNALAAMLQADLDENECALIDLAKQSQKS